MKSSIEISSEKAWELGHFMNFSWVWPSKILAVIVARSLDAVNSVGFCGHIDRRVALFGTAAVKVGAFTSIQFETYLYQFFHITRRSRSCLKKCRNANHQDDQALGKGNVEHRVERVRTGIVSCTLTSPLVARVAANPPNCILIGSRLAATKETAMF